jgi:hypothetical protein
MCPENTPTGGGGLYPITTEGTVAAGLLVELNKLITTSTLELVELTTLIESPVIIPIF